MPRNSISPIFFSQWTHYARVLFVGLIVFCGRPSVVHADSPITSTVFHTAYAQNPMVVKARETGRLDDTIAAYLLNDTVKIGQKAAVINALSWDINGKDNASIFGGKLAGKYRTGTDTLRLHKVSAPDLFCLGYLMVMDNYQNPQRAISVLELARYKAPKSQTISLVFALTLSQGLLHQGDWCSIWISCAEVRANEKLTADLRPAAMDAVFKYISIYQESCN